MALAEHTNFATCFLIYLPMVCLLSALAFKISLEMIYKCHCERGVECFPSSIVCIRFCFWSGPSVPKQCVIKCQRMFLCRLASMGNTVGHFFSASHQSRWIGQLWRRLVNGIRLLFFLRTMATHIHTQTMPDSHFSDLFVYPWAHGHFMVSEHKTLALVFLLI